MHRLENACQYMMSEFIKLLSQFLDLKTFLRETVPATGVVKA